MKKALLSVLLSFTAACATDAAVQTPAPAVASVEKEKAAPVHTHARAPESVIRSGRKDPLLKAGYVLDVLGKPALKRRDPPSEVWVYAQSGCVLFIYMDETEAADQSEALVRHMEIGTPTFRATQKNSLPCLEKAAQLR